MMSKVLQSIAQRVAKFCAADDVQIDSIDPFGSSKPRRKPTLRWILTLRGQAASYGRVPTTDTGERQTPLCLGSTEGEHKSLYTRIQKFDLELSINDGFALSDQLIHPLFDHCAVT